MNLDGRVALVTWASQGIGKACALALAEAGAQVALGARNAEKLQTVAAEIEATGKKALVLSLDVASRDSIKAAVAKTIEAWGKIDILVNNAGIAKDNLALRMKPDEWDAVMRTNLDGAFHCIRYRAEIFIDLHTNNFDTEIIPGFVESGMSRGRCDDVGAGDAFCVVRPIAVGFHCQQNTFRAARTDRAANLVGCFI